MKSQGPRPVSYVPPPSVPPPRMAPASSMPSTSKVVSQVPLPSYAKSSPAQGGPGKKLMSLNSHILAAQREWDEKTQRSRQSIPDDAQSESGSWSASDDSSLGFQGSKTSFNEPLSRTPAGPLAGQKHSRGSVVPEESARPSKRVFSESDRHSSDSPSSSQREDIFTSVNRGSQRGQNSVDYSNRDDLTWLTYTPYDAILTRADGMSYEYFHAGKGKMGTMSGALVPTNYRLDLSVPLPFVCPDKSCDKAFGNPKSLGRHFSAGHKGNAYNDNCDGTFTKVGFYEKRPGQKWRAIVVSRVSVTESEGENAWVDSEPLSFTATDVAKTTPDPFTCVSSYLPHHIDYTRFLSKAYFRELCDLPKRRDLPASWISFHGGKDLSERMFALAVAYLTGTEVFGKDVCSEGLHESGSRLSSCSVTVPFELSDAHKRVLFPEKSCVGCYYSSEISGTVNRCSWLVRVEPFLHRYEKRVDGLGDSDDGDGSYSFTGTAFEVAKQRRTARAVDLAIKAGKAARLKVPALKSLPRPSRRGTPDRGRSVDLSLSPEYEYPIAASMGRSTPEQSTPVYVYGRGLVTEEPTALDNRTRQAHTRQTEQTYHRPSSGRISRSATALQNSAKTQTNGHAPPTQSSYSNPTPPSQLEMEDWEIAPGRMTDATHGENIAYSNAYLNGREPVDVSEDVAFNLITIKSGNKSRWEAHESQLRTCSVASGKLDIKIGANKFGVGPNSVFVIRPGESCVAMNKMYMDATIHCTTVKNYSLLS